MALEQWLYEQIDRGENIDQWLTRILRESKSLAFAGLLFDIGKRTPTLFAGVLKPLLRNWVLLERDRQVTTLRHQDSGPLGYRGSPDLAKRVSFAAGLRRLRGGHAAIALRDRVINSSAG